MRLSAILWLMILIIAIPTILYDQYVAQLPWYTINVNIGAFVRMIVYGLGALSLIIGLPSILRAILLERS